VGDAGIAGMSRFWLPTQFYGQLLRLRRGFVLQLSRQRWLGFSIHHMKEETKVQPAS
jgi:hypothetical protein